MFVEWLHPLSVLAQTQTKMNNEFVRRERTRFEQNSPKLNLSIISGKIKRQAPRRATV